MTVGIFFTGAENRYDAMRQDMIANQIRARGVKDPLVLTAMERVPRHLFVPENLQRLAYSDGPLSIGLDQTISQPYVVAFMTELLKLTPGDRVLEIGTGSGYQAAVLAEAGAEVYSVEILEPLYRKAKELLARLHYRNIHLKLGDGTRGWEEHAPFDKIIVTAAAREEIPPPLKDQLREGGILVMPLGSYDQDLIRAVKVNGELEISKVMPVRFVPLVRKTTT
jgi:protein-L-isoaspartate(D-aspartate) O-methyltransferase